MIFTYFNGESFFIPKLIMKVGGIWPQDRTKLGSMFIFIIYTALKITGIITAVTDFYQNVGSKIGVSTGCANLLVALLVDLSIRLNSDRLFRLIESKMKDSSLVTNPNERQIMKLHQIFGAFFFVFSTLNVFFIPIIRIILIFLFSGNNNSSSNNYTAMSVKKACFYRVEMLVHTLMGYGTLILFWSLNTHLTEQFKILKKHFQQFLRIENKYKSQRRFRRLVDRHNQLLSLSDDLEKSFSVFLAMKVSIRQIIMCFQAHRMAVAKLNGNFMGLASGIQAIAYNSFYMFLLYYSGECLSTSSGEISDVFKGCKWYNLSKDSRINFRIVILESQRPKRLTTAGLYKLNLSNFKYVVQSVYSYISLILAITKN